MGTSLGAFPSSSAAGVKLLNGQYEIMTAVPLPGAGGGLPAFAARHQPSGRADLMAVRASPGAPPRANALARLEGELIPGLLTPLAHGPGPAPEGGETYYVICPEPPGPSLAALTANSSPWSEAEILQYVLRPAAHVLEAAPGPRRRRAYSRRFLSRPTRPCALLPAVAMAVSPMTSTPWG
jgi:hypothetical protein